jgi:hypothetical protein
MRKSAALAAILACSLLPAAAARAQAPTTTPPIHPIGPAQFFQGLVNGKAGESVIRLACPAVSPVVPRKGHPVAGQYVSVHQLFPPGVTNTLGFTGGASTVAATLFVVSPSAASAASAGIPLAVFGLYDQPMEIPTTLTLPCGGAGTVVFAPVQGGPNARSSTNRVKFEFIAATS